MHPAHQKQNRLAYDEYYYRDYRKQKLLVDKKTLIPLCQLR